MAPLTKLGGTRRLRDRLLPSGKMEVNFQVMGYITVKAIYNLKRFYYFFTFLNIFCFLKVLILRIRLSILRHYISTKFNNSFKQMGYKYHLQLDDDTIVNSKINYNLIQRMNSKSLKMAVPYQVWQGFYHIITRTNMNLFKSK